MLTKHTVRARERTSTNSPGIYAFCLLATSASSECRQQPAHTYSLLSVLGLVKLSRFSFQLSQVSGLISHILSLMLHISGQSFET